MRHETILLTVPGSAAPAELLSYLPDNFPELGLDRRRPALIVCPGGGYHMLSDREGEPVALRFMGLDYAVFVLRYHVAPQGHYPTPQRQLLAAIHHVRTHADEYHVDPAAILTMGFSAGAHLACSAGTLWQEPELTEALGVDPALCRPDGMVLGYPVITSGPMAHRNSFVQLLGDRYVELVDAVSLEERVTGQTPPTFLWHTADDTLVPVENSLLLKAALEKHGVPVECHIYPHGLHGQSLADRTVYSASQRWMLSVPCAVWVQRCDAWIQRTFCGAAGELAAAE